MEYPELKQMYELEDSYWWFVARRRLVRDLLLRYTNVAHPRILDAGCGTGGTMQVLQELGEVWGCDISPEALDFCQRRGLEKLVQCPVEDLKFDDGSFDVVISCDVLEHIADDDQALREIYRVLRPGGLAIITVPALQFLWSSHDEVLHHYRRYHKGPLRRMLVSAGFVALKLSYAVSALLPVLVAYRLVQRVVGKRAPQIGIVPVSDFVNRFAIALLRLESFFLGTTGLPWGASLVAVVRKPHIT